MACALLNAAMTMEAIIPVDNYHQSPRRRSIRLPAFDYAGNATCFITICAFDRRSIFGSIADGQMSLTDLGHIVEEELSASIQIRQELDIHHSVVMPNHLHVLLTITPQQHDGPIEPAANQVDGHQARKQRSPRSLGTFVGGFKGVSTRRIRQLEGNPEFVVWQRNYYEHIVRNEPSFQKIWD